jgi:putative endonuclease
MDRIYWVYILASRRNGTLYVGVTNDLGRRAYEHRNGLISGFTKTYHVRLLVYAEAFSNIDDGLRTERAIKRWRRAWKIALIEERNPTWRDLFDEINL